MTESNAQPFDWPVTTPDQGARSPEQASPLVQSLFRHKWSILALSGLGGCAGLLYGASKPNVYESRAMLQYRAGVSEGLSDETLMGIDASMPKMAPPGIADEILLLDDPLIFERHVEALGVRFFLDAGRPTDGDTEKTPWSKRLLHRIQDSMRTPYSESSGEPPLDPRKVAAQVRRSTDIRSMSGTSYIEIRHRGVSPEKAQQSLDRLVDAFMQRHLEAFGVESRLEEQRARERTALEALEEARIGYISYRSECGVFDAEEETLYGRQQVLSMATELREREARAMQLGSRISLLKSRLAAMEPVLTQTKEATEQRNSAHDSIRDRLVELRMEELETQATVMPPQQKQEAMRRISAFRESLQEELKNHQPLIESSGEVVEESVNIRYYEIEASLALLEAEEAGIISVMETMQADLERVTARQDYVAACSDELSRHDELVVAAEREYKKQENITNLLETLYARQAAGESNLTIRRRAQLLENKVGPNRWTPLVGFGALGVVLGVALSILRDRLDRTIRYPDRLERAGGVPVLTVIPETRAARRLPS